MRDAIEDIHLAAKVKKSLARCEIHKQGCQLDRMLGDGARLEGRDRRRPAPVEGLDVGLDRGSGARAGGVEVHELEPRVQPRPLVEDRLVAPLLPAIVRGHRAPQRAKGREENAVGTRERLAREQRPARRRLEVVDPLRERADGIGALQRAFASTPYGPCTCLGSDLLCSVRLLHPRASPLTSTTNPPTRLSVPAMRAKPQVLVHAMGAETTEVLVVCSEHVGSAQELANAMPCSRSKYRLF